MACAIIGECIMTIVGFNFSKLFAQQKKAAKGNLKIGTNVKVEDVQKTNLAIGKEKATVKISFTYNVIYDPDIGGLELQGDVLFMQEEKLIDAVMDEWEKKKSLPKKISVGIVTQIMQKCTIQALVMTKDIGLPPPMPLPKVKSAPMKVKADDVKDIPATPVQEPKKK